MYIPVFYSVEGTFERGLLKKRYPMRPSTNISTLKFTGMDMGMSDQSQ
jgi:hypothetical protein